jgi:S-adenosylmethionine decarboxylase proenzyme
MKRYCIFLLICFAFVVSAYPEEQAETYQFKGTHFLASYSGCDESALTNIEELPQAMLKAVRDCGATILESAEYVFPPDGLTMVILLSESHASIHTYPEHHACFVDLFTCGNKCSFEKFDASLRDYLKPKEVCAKVLSRCQDIEELPPLR